MNVNRINSAARYMKELIARTITAIIIYILRIDLSSLATLSTLNVLKIRIVLNALTAPPAKPWKIVISSIDKITTEPSR